MLKNGFARSMSALLALVALMVILPGTASADPRQRGTEGMRVRQGLHLEWQRAGYRNSDGYVLMVWSDTRTGDRDVYGQLLAPDGTQLWDSTGKPLARLYQYRAEDPDVVACPGGWILGWFDFRDDSTGDTYAQKYDMNGEPQWPTDNNNCGVMLDNYPSAVVELSLRVVYDNAGGVIVAWEDGRRGDDGDIYAQHADANGQRWPETLAITEQLNGQNGITADNDGSGNMLLAWYDRRVQEDPNIYAAKVTPNGQSVWGNVLVCGAPFEQAGVKLCPDGSGGCYISWSDKRNADTNGEDVYAQRLNSSGQPQWAADGIPVCNQPNNQNSPRVAVSLNNGAQDGLITVWQDYRVDNITGEVYCQKFTPAGTALWQANGVKVCGNAGEPPDGGYPREGSRLTSDLSGGMMCAWEDMRDGDHLATSADLYVSHILPNGTQGCGDCGVPVATGQGLQGAPLLRANDGNGVFVIYTDTRNGSTALRYREYTFENCVAGPDTYIVYGLDGIATNPRSIAMSPGRVGVAWEDTRLGVGGKALFYQIIDTTWALDRTLNGDFVAPNNTDGTQYSQEGHRMCSDGANGFFISYIDQRGEVKLIRLSHIGADGNRIGPDSGNVVWNEPGITQDQGPAYICPDEQGGVYIAWSGYTPAFRIDPYVMRMSPEMTPMWSQPIRLRITNTDDIINGVVSNPDGSCILAWQSGDLTTYEVSTARILPDGTVAWNFDLCNAVNDQDNCAIIADGLGGAYYAWSDMRNDNSLRDVYAQHINADSTVTWAPNGISVIIAPQHQNKPVLTMDANRNLYVLWEDFRSGAELDIYGQKITPQGTLLWPSTGKAICVAGGEQKEVAAQCEWDNGLYAVWTDNRHYYPDVYAMHLNESGQPTDPYWLPDSGGVVNEFYQRQDVPTISDDGHGGVMAIWQDYRASGKEPLVNIWGNWLNDYTVSVHEIPNAAIPQKHELAQNYPNPFNPTTEIKFSIPVTEQVEVAIFNTLGQRVATLVNETMHSGAYKISFEATGLPSGTYFYRLHTPTFQTARKMVLLK
jgi:hypothetical protein